MRALLLVLLLVAPLAIAGNAYDDPSGRDATGWNTQRKMARADGGPFYITYLVPEGNSSAVAVAREDADGRVTMLPRPTAARGDASRSTVVLDARGALHVAWTERAEDDREVFHAILRDGAWDAPTQLSGGLGYAGFPSLAAGADGRVHVAWYGFDGTNYQAFYRSWSNGTWEASVQLSSGNLDANNPSVVVDHAGRVHVVWYKDDGHRYRIWHAVRGLDGRFSLPAGLPSATAKEVDAFNGALAVDARGVVHVVWDERHDDGYWIGHSTWSADDGWAPPDILARGAQGGEYPAIAPWGQSVLVAWTDRAGTVVGTDLGGAIRPLLGGVAGRNPSLRGAGMVPASEGDAGLDVLLSRQRADGAWEVARWRVPPDASPFAAREPARVLALEEEMEKSATPSPAWLALGALGAVALTRGRRAARAR